MLGLRLREGLPLRRAVAAGAARRPDGRSATGCSTGGARDGRAVLTVRGRLLADAVVRDLTDCSAPFARPCASRPGRRPTGRPALRGCCGCGGGSGVGVTIGWSWVGSAGGSAGGWSGGATGGDLGRRATGWDRRSAAGRSGPRSAAPGRSAPGRVGDHRWVGGRRGGGSRRRRPGAVVRRRRPAGCRRAGRQRSTRQPARLRRRTRTTGRAGRLPARAAESCRSRHHGRGAPPSTRRWRTTTAARAPTRTGRPLRVAAAGLSVERHRVRLGVLVADPGQPGQLVERLSQRRRRPAEHGGHRETGARRRSPTRWSTCRPAASATAGRRRPGRSAGRSPARRRRGAAAARSRGRPWSPGRAGSGRFRLVTGRSAGRRR